MFGCESLGCLLLIRLNVTGKNRGDAFHSLVHLLSLIGYDLERRRLCCYCLTLFRLLGHQRYHFELANAGGIASLFVCLQFLTIQNLNPIRRPVTLLGHLGG